MVKKGGKKVNFEVILSTRISFIAKKLLYNKGLFGHHIQHDLIS